MAGLDAAVVLQTTFENDGAAAPAAAGAGALAVFTSRTRDIGPDEAAALVRTVYGIAAEATPLSSERDQNFLMRTAAGERTIFKLANAAQDPAIASFQTRALLHIARVDPAVPVPRVIPTLDGDVEFSWLGDSGIKRMGRLVSYLPGTPLAGQPRTLAQAENLGRLAAALGRALRGFFDPAAGHDLIWDLKQAGHIAGLLPCIASERHRELAAAALDAWHTNVLPRLPALRGQVIHNDLNPHNVLCEPGGPDVPCGIIDFGDMVHGALVNDIAVAAAYLVGADDDPLAAVCRLVAAYHDVTPLECEEVVLLPDLMATRHAMTCAITGWRARRYPENAAYIVRNVGAAATGIEVLSRFGREAVAARLLAACGLD